VYWRQLSDSGAGAEGRKPQLVLDPQEGLLPFSGRGEKLREAM